MIGGMQIIVSDAALQTTDVRLFPVSKHRSGRIHKKLLKRFGGEFKRVPAIFQMGDKLVAHPVMYERLKSEVAARARQHEDRTFMSAIGVSGYRGGGL